MNRIARGSLLGIEHMEVAEIVGLLRLARRMNPLKPRPLLRGKRVLLLMGAPGHNAARVVSKDLRRSR